MAPTKNKSDLSNDQKQYFKGLSKHLANRTLNTAEAKQADAEKKQKLIAALLAEQGHVVKEFKALAEQLQNIKETPDFSEFDKLKHSFQQVHEQLLSHSSELENELIGAQAKEQNKLLKEIDGLFETVDTHTQKITAYREAGKERITQATLKAAENTTQMTAGQLLASLVEASGLKLSDEQQQAIEGTKLSALLSHEDRLQLENGDTSSALALLNTVVARAESSEDKALVAPLQALVAQHGDVAIANLPVALLPADAQIALIANAFDQLVQATENMTDKEVLGQIAHAFKEDIKGLSSGEKSHLSLVANTNGKTQMMSIEIAHLLNNPLEWIEKIGHAMFDGGTRAQSITIKLTNPLQQEALAQISGTTYNSSFIMDVMQHADNQVALSATLGQVGIQGESDALTALRAAGFEPKPLNPTQVIQVAVSVVTLVNTINIAQDPKANLNLQAGNNPSAVRQLFNAQWGVIENNQPLDVNAIQGSNVLGIQANPNRGHPNSVHASIPRAVVIVGNGLKHAELIARVKSILSTLSIKIDSERDNGFKQDAKEVYSKLNAKLEAFSKSDDMTPKAFLNDMTGIIKADLPKFDKTWKEFFENLLVSINNFLSETLGFKVVGYYQQSFFKVGTRQGLNEANQSLNQVNDDLNQKKGDLNQAGDEYDFCEDVSEAQDDLGDTSEDDSQYAPV